MKFLVVDDSATMRRIVMNSLRRIGFSDFVEASDGVEALDSFDPSIEFVITDWNMPNMGGIDFVRQLRSLVLSLQILPVNLPASGPYPLRDLLIGIGFLKSIAAFNFKPGGLP